MRFKSILTVFCLVFFICPNLSETQVDLSLQGEFGFTGEVEEYVIKQFNPTTIERLRTQANLPNPVSVVPLMVGFSKIDPTDVDFECFSFIDYYWDGSTTSNKVALIVANYDNTTANSTWISVDVIGPKHSKLLIKRSIPQYTAILYKFTINLANEVGMYELVGTINSKKVQCSQVKTRFYIEEIW